MDTTIKLEVDLDNPEQDPASKICIQIKQEISQLCQSIQSKLTETLKVFYDKFEEYQIRIYRSEMDSMMIHFSDITDRKDMYIGLIKLQQQSALMVSKLCHLKEQIAQFSIRSLVNNVDLQLPNNQPVPDLMPWKQDGAQGDGEPDNYTGFIQLYKCSICGQDKVGWRSISIHLKLDHRQSLGWYRCLMCPANCSKSVNMAQHLIREHCDGPYYRCPVTKKQFHRISDLKDFLIRTPDYHAEKPVQDQNGPKKAD